LIAFIEHDVHIKDYYIYEIEDKNYKRLIDNVKKINKSYPDINVMPRNKGVYNKSGKIYFDSEGEGTHLVEYQTDNYARVLKLDDDVKTPITYIKMDIEGSEYQALDGAREIIQKYKPLLAISLYHLKDDFRKLPLLINEICPEYKHYCLEQYSYWYYDTVLYVSIY
jgi:FkbM family methyltransferase